MTIKSYLEVNDCSPLKFKEGFVSEISPEKSIVDNIQSVLDECRESATFFEDGEYQCKIDARRTSFDIWKIIKNYIPDITLYQVILGLDEIIKKGDTCAFKCSTIGKFVFNQHYFGIGDLISGNPIKSEYDLTWDECVAESLENIKE